MARSGARLLLWLLVLCMPLQGFGVAWARLSGALHFHVAIDDDAMEHAHDEGHQHASVEQHHHDAEDDSVVHVDDGNGPALNTLPVIASTRVLDIDGMPHAFAAATPVLAAGAVADVPVRAFRSFVAEPPERPPR